MAKDNRKHRFMCPTQPIQMSNKDAKHIRASQPATERRKRGGREMKCTWSNVPLCLVVCIIYTFNRAHKISRQSETEGEVRKSDKRELFKWIELIWNAEKVWRRSNGRDARASSLQSI